MPYCVGTKKVGWLGAILAEPHLIDDKKFRKALKARPKYTVRHPNTVFWAVSHWGAIVDVWVGKPFTLPSYLPRGLSPILNYILAGEVPSWDVSVPSKLLEDLPDSSLFRLDSLVLYADTFRDLVRSAVSVPYSECPLYLSGDAVLHNVCRYRLRRGLV
jgi:hypothetical protein